MCLLSRHRFPKISFRKIKVYKLVQFKDGELYAPFMKCKLTEDPTEKFSLPKFSYKKRWHVKEDCMVYACTTLKMAKTMRENLASYRKESENNYIIISAYIPPFTRYYLGKHNDVCSRKMKYVLNDQSLFS